MKLRYFSAFLTLFALFCLFNVALLAQDTTSAAAGTNSVSTNQPAKPPGQLFTNSVKMELVKVGDGIWAGKFEVTQKEFEAVMGSNPSQFRGETFPVDSVTWNEAMDFCQRMTDLDLKTNSLPKGFTYSLPTEDEWKMLVADATVENAVTSLGGTKRSGPSPVGTTNPNSLGLYDVRGNVMEFCLSDASKAFRYLKGGSWQDFVEVNLRPEFRWYCKPDERKNTFGFRCLLKSDGR